MNSYTFARRLRGLGIGLVLSVWASARAGLYEYHFVNGLANGGHIPDATLSGWSDARTISGLVENQIVDVSVKVNISGGYNGDLYAYLSFGNVLVPLLNRVGVGASTPTSSAFGYSDAGFDVTFSSAGGNDIHWYRETVNPAGGQLTGTWQPDGRAIDPLSPAASFDSSSRISFSGYNGMDPNGTWYLFLADVSGGAQSTIASWDLDIMAVPEPANVALGIFASLLLFSSFWRLQALRRLLQKSRVCVAVRRKE